MKALCPYGTHRVLSPRGALPQSATKLDNNMKCLDNEIMIDVLTLNIDSASFAQIKDATNCNLKLMEEMILDIVAARGKMQNPITGSGGMLLGIVQEIGKDLDIDLQVGDKITTLVSLSLTPLKINKIKKIHLDKDQVDIEGNAIIFSTGIYAKIPTDLSEKLVLSALDVAGAPAQTEKLVKENDSVLILGAAGKSGVLCAYQAKKNAGINGRVIGLVNEKKLYDELKELNICDEVIIADAKKPISVYKSVLEHNNNELVDVVINCVNVSDTEMAAILAAKPNGLVYFFSMATSFTKAALGAEGVASEATMIIGNGYTFGHVELTLNILRESKIIHDLFMKRYN